MRKLVFLTLVGLMAFTGNVFAGNSSGCGLGATIWGGSKGLIPNLMASTTNGTSGSQTFGMTSGTSDCKASDTVQLEQQQKVFVAQNHEMISEQAATGNGEYLVAFAKVLGCDSASFTVFASETQANYGKIFSGASVAGDVLVETKTMIKGNPVLANSCSRI